MKYIVIIAIALILIGCNTTKTVSNTSTTDTIFKNRIVKITPSQLSNLTVDDVCDSLGSLKPFNYTFGSGKTKTIIKTVDNTIYLEQNLDSIKEEIIKEYISKNNVYEKVLTIEKKSIPSWIWYSFGLNLLLLVWTFRKLIFKL